MRKLLPWTYGVRNLGRSRVRLVLSIGGSALVVLLVLCAAAFVRGMEKSLAVSGASDNVILLGAGSQESVERSEISATAGAIVAASVPGLRAQLGVTYVSPEIHAGLMVQTDKDSPEYMSMMRGVTPEAFLVHPQVRITEGTAPGTGEILVGRLAGARMGVSDANLAPGRTLWFDNRAWRISGRFEAPGTVMEAELWLQLTDLQIASKRESSLSCVVLTLDDAEFDDVDAFCKSRLDLELAAMHENEYYAKLSAFYQPVKSMVWLTALMIAMGGLFGGLNTMYAAFAARVRELGALQALGFSRTAIVVSLMQESCLAAITGTLVACGLGLMLLDGVAIRFSMGAFGMVMDAPVMVTGLIAGLMLGVVGALPPAWRCLRLPITEALNTA